MQLGTSLRQRTGKRRYRLATYLNPNCSAMAGTDGGDSWARAASSRFRIRCFGGKGLGRHGEDPIRARILARRLVI